MSAEKRLWKNKDNWLPYIDLLGKDMVAEFSVFVSFVDKHDKAFADQLLNAFIDKILVNLLRLDYFSISKHI